METKYFKEYLKDVDNLTAQKLKGMWRKLVVKIHPDKGGSEEQFKEAQNEYEYLLNRVNAGFTAVSDSPESFESWEQFMASISPIVREAFEKVYSIPNVTDIEVCGWWIWVGLDYKKVDPRREALKAINVSGKKFKFSGKKKRWYWAGIASRNTGKAFTMDEIRDYYGSQRLKKEEEETRSITA
jgi:curved DNA-binding protein CbpA